ncbi:MAG: helix-turn-helix transcriptional regulator [Deltaproteobacteria bacterium]|nr:helix-turn-helix transcriptional regulator [Deltaproteobacteria bacterium]
MSKKRGHVGGDVVADVRARMARDPEFAAGVQAEYDRLQLARKVRSARQARGLSQASLARMVGTKQPAIARLERGHVLPRLDLLERIAKALGAHLHVDLELVEERT